MSCSECNPQGYPDPIPPFVPCPNCSPKTPTPNPQAEEAE